MSQADSRGDEEHCLPLVRRANRVGPRFICGSELNKMKINVDPIKVMNGDKMTEHMDYQTLFAARSLWQSSAVSMSTIPDFSLSEAPPARHREMGGSRWLPGLFCSVWFG